MGPVTNGTSFISARRNVLICSGAILGIITGLILILGPTEPVHHQLHKWDVQPYFERCCCVYDEDHTSAPGSTILESGGRAIIPGSPDWVRLCWDFPALASS